MNANVKKLGISRQVPGSRSNFFFNKFVSQLLFNGQDQADSDLIGKCLSRLDAVAIVTIIKPESEVLAPVRESFAKGTPIKWVRVHKTPDYAYFDHSAHVNRGVGCVSCHGRVDQMDVVKQVEPLSMTFCLDCHRNPEANIRDPEKVTQLDFVPDEADYGKKWAEKLKINTNISCSTCHR